MTMYLIFRNNMNSLFCNYYFESEEACHKYMKENWYKQKYHIQEVKQYPKKLTPITEQGLLSRGFKMRVYNNVIRHYYIPATPEKYKENYELFVTFNEMKDSKPNEVCREGWAPVLSGAIHSFGFKSMEDIESAYEMITKKQLPNNKKALPVLKAF